MGGHTEIKPSLPVHRSRRHHDRSGLRDRAIIAMLLGCARRRPRRGAYDGPRRVARGAVVHRGGGDAGAGGASRARSRLHPPESARRVVIATSIADGGRPIRSRRSRRRTTPADAGTGPRHEAARASAMGAAWAARQRRSAVAARTMGRVQRRKGRRCIVEGHGAAWTAYRMTERENVGDRMGCAEARFSLDPLVGRKHGPLRAACSGQLVRPPPSFRAERDVGSEFGEAIRGPRSEPIPSWTTKSPAGSYFFLISARRA